MHKGLKPSAVSTITVPPSNWWRVHFSKHGPLVFNATNHGNSRFSPITDSGGDIIPTLYCGSSIKVALMESVLHDVPIPSDRFIYFAPAPVDEERNLVGITNVVPLVLADFSTVGLRRLGLTRSKVVDSEKSEYSATRLLAQWLYQNCPNIQGIQWTSRQYDLGQTIMLFESRLESNCLSVRVPSESIANDLCQDEILALITALGGGLKQG